MPGRNTLPDHLPRREEIIAVEGEERLWRVLRRGALPQSATRKKEVLDMEPARYFVRVIKREKLACRKCPEGGVVTAAAGGPKIVEKGKLSDRCGCRRAHQEIPLPPAALTDRQPICRETTGSNFRAARSMRPSWPQANCCFRWRRSLSANLLEGGYIQADETPIGVQSQETKGRNHQAYEFQYSRPGGPVVFDFCMSRAREGPS